MYKHFEIISFHWIAVSVCKKCITTPALSAGGNNQEDPSLKHCQQAIRRENWHYFPPAQTQRLLMKVDTAKEALRKAQTLGRGRRFPRNPSCSQGRTPSSVPFYHQDHILWRSPGCKAPGELIHGRQMMERCQAARGVALSAEAVFC